MADGYILRIFLKEHRRVLYLKKQVVLTKLSK